MMNGHMNSFRDGGNPELSQLYDNRQQLFRQIIEASNLMKDGVLNPTTLEEAKQHLESLRESSTFTRQRIKTLEEIIQKQDDDIGDLPVAGNPRHGVHMDQDDSTAEVELEVQSPDWPYKLYQYHGGTHRLPRGWKFPSCSVFQLWKLWLLGENGHCPLKFIRPPDLRSLDTFNHMRCRHHMAAAGDGGGVHMDGMGPPHRRHFRNPMANTMSQIRFVCNYIELKVRLNSSWTDTHTTESAERMFLDTETQIIPIGKQRQMQWSAFLTVLHRQGHRARQVKHALEEMRERILTVPPSETTKDSKKEE